SHTALSTPGAPHCFPTRRSSDLLRQAGETYAGRTKKPLFGFSISEYHGRRVGGRIGRIPGSLQHERDRAQRGGLSKTFRGDFPRDRKSTRLNSSHVKTSYAVFCL